MNCVSLVKAENKIIYRFQSRTRQRSKGLNLLKTDGAFDDRLGCEVCVLETDLDPEGNSVNATIVDNAGICIACSVLFQGVHEMKPDEAKPDEAKKPDKLTGYAHASGTAPYDKYCDTLLTIGNYCYEINTDRIDFFFHFVDKTAEIEFNDNSITMICGEKRLDAIVLEVCDAVCPEDAGLTQEQADELYEKIAKISPYLQ